MRSFQRARYYASTSPNAKADMVWTTTITAAGAEGDVWTAKWMGQTVTFTAGAAPSTTDIADGIAAALDALAGSTSTNAAAVITTTRSAAPTNPLDEVSYLEVTTDGAGTLTNVVATEDSVAFAETRVFQSVP